MKSKTSKLVLEARRLQCGNKRRQVKAELHGAGLELWDDLAGPAAAKGIDTSGLVTLLLIHGHGKVRQVVEALTNVQSDQA